MGKLGPRSCFGGSILFVAFLALIDLGLELQVLWSTGTYTYLIYHPRQNPLFILVRGS